jgi:hypothetical protein
MFVSRTVAAEVLMEAESNRAGYAALKTLDREGGLRFSLAYVSSHPPYDFIERTCISSLVEDLIKVGPSGTISPDITQKHFTSVVYQVSLDHDAIHRNIAQLPVERLSKPTPCRSTRHASHGLHRLS